VDEAAFGALEVVLGERVGDAAERERGGGVEGGGGEGDEPVPAGGDRDGGEVGEEGEGGAVVEVGVGERGGLVAVDVAEGEGVVAVWVLVCVDRGVGEVVDVRGRGRGNEGAKADLLCFWI